MTETNQTQEIDFDTSKKIAENVGSQLMDIDYLAHNLMGNIKGVSTEMEYQIQLDINNRIYLVFMTIGFLLIVSVLLFTG